MITNDPHSVYQKRLEEYLQRKDILLNSNMEMWSIEAAKKSVISNLGITYLPLYTIREELRNGSLIPIKTELDEVLVDVICAFHKNKWISTPMELFIRLLKQKFDEARVTFPEE